MSFDSILLETIDNIYKEIDDSRSCRGEVEEVMVQLHAYVQISLDANTPYSIEEFKKKEQIVRPTVKDRIAKVIKYGIVRGVERW